MSPDTKKKVAIGPSSFGAADPAPVERLREAGLEVIPNPFGRRLTEDEIRRQLADADALIAGLEPLNRSVLEEAAPRLTAIARVGIGMDNVDEEAARDLGIAVSNTPDQPARAVAELTLGAMLALTRDLVPANAALHGGEWRKEISPGLDGACVLIVGRGRIGGRVAELLEPFGADILVHDPYLPEESAPRYRRVGLGEGLEQATIVTLHAGRSDRIIGRDELSRMKQGAFLLNAARAGLVDEAALIEALETGRLGGAWFDVFWEEPYSGPLTRFDNVLLTPHVGTYTAHCRLSMEMAAVENLLRDLEASA